MRGKKQALANHGNPNSSWHPLGRRTFPLGVPPPPPRRGSGWRAACDCRRSSADWMGGRRRTAAEGESRRGRKKRKNPSSSFCMDGPECAARADAIPKPGPLTVDAEPDAMPPGVLGLAGPALGRRPRPETRNSQLARSQPSHPSAGRAAATTTQGVGVGCRMRLPAAGRALDGRKVAGARPCRPSRGA